MFSRLLFWRRKQTGIAYVASHDWSYVMATEKELSQDNTILANIETDRDLTKRVTFMMHPSHVRILDRVTKAEGYGSRAAFMRGLAMAALRQRSQLPE